MTVISHEEALERIRRRVARLGTEELPVAQCMGRTLAEDVVARVSCPPFDKSAMDGFAVRESDVGSLPAELEVVGESAAGQWPDFTVGPGQCAIITTGAPLPGGADTVVMVEDTEQRSEKRVVVKKLSGANICPEGEDLREGRTVLRSGEALTPLRIGVAASVGYDRLVVHRRPAIALLCTGAEIVEPPASVRRGQIYNANGPLLSSLLAPLSSRFEYLGVVEDSPEATQATIRRGLDYDLLVVTGGVSVGPHDLVPDALQELGVETVFHRCAIKPGKPSLFGVHTKGCVFGLPGNPQSGFVVFHILLRPIIARMSGAAQLPPTYKTGIMRHGFDNKPARKNFKPCSVETADGVNRIRLAAWQGSADIMGTSTANSFVVVPQGTEKVDEGETIEFFEV